MKISVSKRDIYWNYIAQFFGIGSGFIVLPVVLRMLSSEEVGMNYLMLSVSSLVALADFGFSSQFGRNITYVFSGAQELKKDGMSSHVEGEVNYHLLAVVIETAKYLYRRISFFVLLLMITLGSAYMYRATNGFTSVNYSFYIWLLFSCSTFFNMYFMYYSSLLTGAAMIMESKQATILNRLSYIFISFVLLFSGFGLFSIVIANFIAPFVGRWYSYRKFYTKEMLSCLQGEHPVKEEIKDTFNILWYNAKKLGINFIGAYGVQQSSTFVIGLFLPLYQVASYGLMCQLFQISSAFSMGVFTALLPAFYNGIVENKKDKIISDFSFSSFVFFVCFIICSFMIILGGNFCLNIIGSSTKLPLTMVIIVYSIHMFLENYHSICSSMIVAQNEVPFVIASLLSGAGSVLCNLLTLKYTSFGLLGVVLGLLFVQSLYNHWKWPLWVFKEYSINPLTIVKTGFLETNRHLCGITRSLFNG